MNADLMSFLPLQDFGARLSRDENNTLVIDDSANDIWGWADPVSGREFAIIGMSTGTSFVEITNPSNPIHVGVLPTHGVVSFWRDIKTFLNHAFIVAEGRGQGMQVSIRPDVIVCQDWFALLACLLILTSYSSSFFVQLTTTGL
jgi:choice-of-anchor B domain-containing protein